MGRTYVSQTQRPMEQTGSGPEIVYRWAQRRASRWTRTWLDLDRWLAAIYWKILDAEGGELSIVVDYGRGLHPTMERYRLMMLMMMKWKMYDITESLSWKFLTQSPFKETTKHKVINGSCRYRIVSYKHCIISHIVTHRWNESAFLIREPVDAVLHCFATAGDSGIEQCIYLLESLYITLGILFVLCFASCNYFIREHNDLLFYWRCGS